MDDKLLKTLQIKYSVDNEKANFIFGKVKLAEKTWKTLYTDFLTLNEQEFLKELSLRNDVFITFQGDDSFERKIASISLNEDIEDFPSSVLRISGNFKFEKVTHRDYLGSILGLGIKREKIGDINVYEDGAEVLVHNDILDYIIFNLNSIKHTTVKAFEIDFKDMKRKSQKFEEKNVNVASLRFDAILSSVFNISRTKSSSFMK